MIIMLPEIVCSLGRMIYLYQDRSAIPALHDCLLELGVSPKNYLIRSIAGMDIVAVYAHHFMTDFVAYETLNDLFVTKKEIESDVLPVFSHLDYSKAVPSIIENLL